MTNVNRALAALGREIRRIREESGLTQEELAERAELSSIYIGTIENGKRDPSLWTVCSLAEGLGIPMVELFRPPPLVSEAAKTTATLFDKRPEDLGAALIAFLLALQAALRRQKKHRRRKKRRR